MATEKKGALDSHAQIAAIYVEEASANAGAISLFSFPFSILDKMALNIARIEYWPSEDKLVGTGDSVVIAVAAAKAVSDITDQTDPAILDSFAIIRVDAGTAANAIIKYRPFVKDFSSLPGGGLLVAPNPLSVAIKGFSLAAAANAWVRIHYTYMTLTTDEYWQLVEARRIISNN